MRRKRSQIWPWRSVVAGLLAWLLSLPAGTLGLPSCTLSEAQTSIVCQMRTLNSQNSSQFAGQSALDTIRIRCSDVFFYESFLKTNHFGYLPELEALDLEFCKIRRVPSLAFSGLSNLRSLSLCTHNSEWSAMIMELEKDALTGLNRLEYLNLTQNNMWTLPPSVFCSLDSLVALNLSMNYLQDVADLGFASQDLRSCRLPLETLDLSHNSFTIVPTTALGQLERLKTLILTGNNLNILEDDAFGGLASLTKLELANNELVALPPHTFREMNRLQELYLQNNSLTALAPGIFSRLESLLLLNLSRNDITNDWLNTDAFSSLHQLRALDLSHNQLARLDSNLFRGMGSLKILNLEHNHILTLEANTFQYQAQHLQILYLSHNRIENLHPKAIHNLSFLNSLSLDHNQLRNLHRNALRNCSTLQDLALHNNLLREIPKSVRSLPLLRTLDLGGNGIKHVKNDSLKGLSHLYGLRLADNGLEYIDQDAFATVPNLQVLNLAHNKMEKDNLHMKVLFPLQELRVLRLDNNRLEDINGLLQSQSELLWLNVSANRLQWFDYASIPKSLRWLDLHSNQLQDLGNYFELKTGFSLETLDASHNRLTRVGPLSIVASLQNVFLNKNQIASIEANSFAENANLERVDLTENELRHLQISALSGSAQSLPAGTLGLPSCTLSEAQTSIVCQMRTLNSQNSSQFAGQSALDTIRIRCSDVFFYESFLKTNHFGYLPELEALDLEFCKIRRVPSLAFSGLSNLRSLSLCTHNSEWSAMIMELEKDALTGLNRLEYLNLTQNNMWTLPPSVFCSLDSLVALNLSMNYLQDVADLGFASQDLRSCRLPLETLDLSHNSFTIVPTTALGQLERLKTLILTGNNLNILEDDAFGGLASLTKLELANNELVALPPHTFREMNRLQELYLQNNSLTALAPGIFSRLESLLLLNLSRNDITNDWLNTDAFSSLHQLRALDLSHNQLARLDSNLFRGMGSLKILNLEHNHILTLEANTFQYQAQHLQILYLSHNRIENLHPKAIHNLSFLNSLSLDHNQLRNLHRNALRNCSTLQDLALHNNLLREIPKSVRSLPLLRTLDLGGNGIKHVKNDSLKGLSHLYGLRLADNGLEYIDQDAFATVPNLQVLNLAHNKMEKDNLHMKVLFPLQELRVLRLDNNRLEDINGLLQSQSELLWLNVSANRLQWFDYASIPKSLRWLDLHSNQLQDLGNYFELKTGFSLETLDASHNRLTRVGPLSIVASLQNVFLNKNQIASIEANSFAENANLERAEFFLAGNPFLCDCEMEWLQKINQVSLGSAYPRVMDLDNIRCELNNKHPNQSLLAQVPILGVRPQEFVCEYQAHCFALCMCCDFFACDCRMQCPGGCTCFHDSAWSSNIIQCSMRGHLDIPPLIPMDATSIYLDGNNFTGTLESQAFIGRKRVQALFLNHSQIEAINNQTFNGLTELEVLHLEDNFIRRLEGYEFGNLTSLQELHLQNNRLIFIHDQSFSTLVALEVLHLHGNLLKTYPIWSLQTLPQLAHVSLSENPWSCECEFVQQFQEFVQSRSLLIADLHLVQCYTEEQKVYLNQNVTCSDALAVTSSNGAGSSSGHQLDLMNTIPLLVAVIALCVVIICSSLVIFVFRTPLRVWLHSKYGIRVLEPCRKSSQDKPYDAFLGYSLKDEDFIQQILVPHLEQSEPGYKLCLQHRDLPNTSSISDTFPSVAQLCAKHMLIVSRAYLESEWIQIKFALQDSQKLPFKPVIILLEELTSLDLAAAPEFNLLLKTAVVLRWNEAGFWNKLRYFLPDSYSKYKSNIISPGAIIASPSPLHGSKASPRSTNHPSSSLVQSSDWYDAVINSNDSSTSTRSTIMGGSPREQTNNGGSASVPVQVLANPMMLDHWAPSEGSESAYSWNDHTYQTIPHPSKEHTRQTYHNLDDSENLGSVDVMLPNGQMVPATLVRNATGKIVPVVQVETVPRQHSHLLLHHNRPPHNDLEEKQPLRHQEVTFPRTVVYRHQNQTHFVPSGGHLV
eukprot:maker-scaffold23_size669530-snap-gene-5.24 protein:Tk11078 transcript:maker-scaffold23_size669530-snap-gene-5.24-mRNA-1 annotation:"toll "